MWEWQGSNLLMVLARRVYSPLLRPLEQHSQSLLEFKETFSAL